MHLYYTYILANQNRRLYVGVTNNIRRRMWEHKSRRKTRSFTARYNIDKLVFYEKHTYINNAIAREKMYKGWRRSRKIAFIEKHNKEWLDLATDWFKTTRSP